MIWLGDNVYADTKDDIGYIEKCYGMLAAHPAFEQPRKEVPFAPIWDDLARPWTSARVFCDILASPGRRAVSRPPSEYFAMHAGFTELIVAASRADLSRFPACSDLCVHD